jgi:mRNA-degrading endonuclease RelE of RelBE toxin-antitoxin system
MFDVRLGNQAEKFLGKCEVILKKRISKKIKELKIKPVFHYSKIIQGMKNNCFRIRVGDYRIFYYVDYEEKEITVFKIGKRGIVYK